MPQLPKKNMDTRDVTCKYQNHSPPHRLRSPEIRNYIAFLPVIYHGVWIGFGVKLPYASTGSPGPCATTVWTTVPFDESWITPCRTTFSPCLNTRSTPQYMAASYRNTPAKNTKQSRHHRGSGSTRPAFNREPGHFTVPSPFLYIAPRASRLILRPQQPQTTPTTKTTKTVGSSGGNRLQWHKGQMKNNRPQSLRQKFCTHLEQSRGSHITSQVSTESITRDATRTSFDHSGGAKTWRVRKEVAIADNTAVGIAAVRPTTAACCRFRRCLNLLFFSWGERRVWV